MPYVGQIKLFAGNFAPAGWMFCDGQLLPISENETLYNLIGTTFGGDGSSTFGLPDLRGRAPIHMGSGPGLSSRTLAEYGGATEHTLTVNQLPVHNHIVQLFGVDNKANRRNTKNPETNHLGNSGNKQYNPAANATMQALSTTGGSQPHNNMMPYLAVSYIISLFGTFPTPN